MLNVAGYAWNFDCEKPPLCQLISLHMQAILVLCKLTGLLSVSSPDRPQEAQIKLPKESFMAPLVTWQPLTV